MWAAALVLGSVARRQLLVRRLSLEQRAIDKCEADIARGVRLFVVPTPLGELSDMTYRGAACLARADVIACEDTRRLGLLLVGLGIERKGSLLRHDAVTADKSADRLVETMKNSSIVALASDAGTPGISDPGALLVQRAAEAGVKVAALPGACAATTALSASGLDTSQGFCFLGFVQGRTAAARRTALAAAVAEAETRPVVLYESPRRVLDTVRALADLDPSRRVLVARELTKTHEDLWRGSLRDAATWLENGGGGGDHQRAEPRGEFTLVLDRGPSASDDDSAADLDDLARDRLRAKRASGLSLSAAAKAVALELRLRKSHVYNLALPLDEEHGEPTPR